MNKSCLQSLLDFTRLIELDDLESIDCVQHGADFIKTSTGKIQMGASTEAVNAIIQAINQFHQMTQQWRGIKISGGIKTDDQAWHFINRVHQQWGDAAVLPNRLRIGA